MASRAFIMCVLHMSSHCVPFDTIRVYIYIHMYMCVCIYIIFIYNISYIIWFCGLEVVTHF